MNFKVQFADLPPSFIDQEEMTGLSVQFISFHNYQWSIIFGAFFYLENNLV